MLGPPEGISCPYAFPRTLAPEMEPNRAKHAVLATGEWIWMCGVFVWHLRECLAIAYVFEWIFIIENGEVQRTNIGPSSCFLVIFKVLFQRFHRVHKVHNVTSAHLFSPTDCAWYCGVWYFGALVLSIRTFFNNSGQHQREPHPHSNTRREIPLPLATQQLQAPNQNTTQHLQKEAGEVN